MPLEVTDVYVQRRLGV